jgi:hypothetical protein
MEHENDGGAMEDNYIGFAKRIAIRNSNGNLLSGKPKGLNEVANKKYVDDAVANVSGGSVDLSDYYTKDEVDKKIDNLADVIGDFNDDISNLYKIKADETYVDGLVGDINSALTELHNYAQALIEGGNS